LQHALPPMIAQHMLPAEGMNTHPVMRFWFLGSAATQPIISLLIRQFGLRVNILQGNVEYVKQHSMGLLIVAIDGEKHQLQAAQDYLKKMGVQVEVLGHVPNDIISFI